MAPELTSLLLHKRSPLTAILGFLTSYGLCCAESKTKSPQPTVPPPSAVSLSFLHLPSPDSLIPALWTLPILAAPWVAMPSLSHFREGLKEAAEPNLILGTPCSPDYIQKFQVHSSAVPNTVHQQMHFVAPQSLGFPASRPSESCTVSLP